MMSVAGLALSAMPALANEAAPASTDAAAAATGNDIVVTAQRREQRLQDVPIPISAFSGSDVKRLQINNAFDIAKYVPSTHITQSAFKGTATYFIRGVGSLDITTTNDPPITTYENDLIIPRANANNIGLYDVERIEVLRGPQGTLFGRNTSGGAIDIVLKKPADTAGGYVEGNFGTYHKFTVRGSIDLPLSDTIKTKTSGFYVNDPGYVHNITTGERLNGEKNFGIREDVRIKLAPDFTWDLSGSYERNQGLGFALMKAGPPAPNSSSPPAPVYYQTNDAVHVSDCGPNPLATYLAGGGGNCSVTRTLGLGSIMNYKTAAGSLQFLYGFRQYWARYSFDVPTSTNPTFGGTNLISDGYGYSHSAELKWSSELFDNRLKYVAGVYYLNIIDNNRLNTLTATGNKVTILQDIDVLTKTNSIAGYLQGDIKLAEPLVLTLGGRFTHDVKELGYAPETQYGAPTLSTASVLAVGQPVKLTSNRFTPRAALQYTFDRDVNVYLSATNGFKAGGWNARTANPRLVVAVAPERVWSYELGLRSQFLDRHLTVNLTAFQQTLKGYQNTVQTVLPSTGVLTTLLENIADLRVRGVEFETNYVVSPNFSLMANGSFLNAKYTKIYQFPGVPAANQLQPTEQPTQAPKFQLTAGPVVHVPFSDNRDMTLSVLWRHSSTYQIAILNPVRTPVDNFIDANIQYDAKQWYASVACTNCNNRKSYMLILANDVYPIDPRRITATVGVRF
jgi:iron complex outermembrane receptor protein